MPAARPRQRSMSRPPGAVAILVTLDTKGPEARYLRDRIVEWGGRALVVDIGMAGTPRGVAPEISREDVARAAGSTSARVARLGRGEAVETMQRGLAPILRRLQESGEVAGVMAIGGSDGAITAATAMQALPMGVPKLIVSPATQGQTPFGPYVGTSDMTIMHSVVDILGINQFSRKIFDNAAGAILGMVRAQAGTELRPGRQVAATMYGNTTPAVMRAKEIIERQGYEVVVFHPNGTGGRAMEDLIEQGLFEAVLDFTTHEITDELYGGFHAAGPRRLEAAGRLGVPQLVIPGCVDFLIRETRGSLRGKYRNRKSYHFNPVLSLVRATRSEMAHVGRVMAAKLNRAKGPTTVLIPRGGFSMYACDGRPLHDPRSDAAFVSSLKRYLRRTIPVLEEDAWINDPQFADRAACLLLEMLQKRQPETRNATG